MLSIILFLIVVGVVLYIVDTLLPIDARIKNVIYILVCLGVLIWLLQAIGIQLPYLSNLSLK